ncbi:MAG: HAMP domain-containing protein [Thermoleophilia bacterium]|nr:HAMP domain-containing protein [Thermoleophilia bacterium]
MRARTIVAAVLIGASLISVAVLLAFTLVSAEELLNDTARDELIDIGDSRVTRIEDGVARLKAEAVTLAADRGVTRALKDLTKGFNQLDDPLSPKQREELIETYRTGIRRVTPPGVQAPSLESLVPGDQRSQYLQYHYLTKNPLPPERRSELDKAPDGSTYSTAHARHHPTLRALREAGLPGDLLLIDAESEHVVYSTDKQADFGTGLRMGPHRESGLARAVLDELQNAGADQAVFVDFDAYAPAGFTPTAFAAATIREDGRVVGAVAVEVPVGALTEITTADGQWEDTGLGDTGEIYIVGPDRLMRSDSRLFLEDPPAYQERLADTDYPPEIGEAVEAFDTTVLVQPVETEAVRAGLAGDVFVGGSRNYLGQDTLTLAAPVRIPDVQWIAVAEVTTDEAYEPLTDYFWRVLILAVILIPLVAIVGVLVARRLLRPIGRVIGATRRVGEGDLDIELPAQGNDEFDELGRRFNEMVGELRAQSVELARADEDTTELLSAALPRRLVERVKHGDREVVEAARNATIIAISIRGLSDEPLTELETLRDLGVDLAARLDALAEEHGVEPVHSASSQLIYAAGLDTRELEVDRAAAFVNAVRAEARAFASTHLVPLEFSAGLAAGGVMAGVVGTERLGFGVWGDPPRRAVTREAVAQPDQILVDDVVADAIGDDWPMERIAGLMSLTGEPLACWALGEPAPEAVDGDDVKVRASDETDGTQ